MKRRLSIVLLCIFICSAIFSPALAASLTDLPGHWAASDVQKLIERGAIGGYPDGTFRPDATISRAEAVTMLSRVFDRDSELTDSLLSIPRFTDVSPSDWFYAVIQEASISHFKKS